MPKNYRPAKEFFIRRHVTRVFPEFPPFLLNLPALEALADSWKAGEHAVVRHMLQQSMLASALQALDEGDDVDYLTRL